LTAETAVDWRTFVADKTASMGPPFFDGGNGKDVELPIRGSKLQWGRRFLTAETILRQSTADARSAASMGPPFFDGGNRGSDMLRRFMDSRFNGAAVF